MTFLLDTSVYLRILLDAWFARQAEPFLRRIAPRMFLSSVVRAELTQGARGAEGRALVDRLAAQLERARRVVTPTHEDWVEAGTVQSLLWDVTPSLRTKSLLHDVLLALAARRIGARLVTDNEKDFEAIGRWIPTIRVPSASVLTSGSP